MEFTQLADFQYCNWLLWNFSVLAGNHQEDSKIANTCVFSAEATKWLLKQFPGDIFDNPLVQEMPQS